MNVNVDKDTSYAQLGNDERKLIHSLEETINTKREDGNQLILIAYQSPKVR